MPAITSRAFYFMPFFNQGHEISIPPRPHGPDLQVYWVYSLLTTLQGLCRSLCVPLSSLSCLPLFGIPSSFFSLSFFSVSIHVFHHLLLSFYPPFIRHYILFLFLYLYVFLHRLLYITFILHFSSFFALCFHLPLSLSSSTFNSQFLSPSHPSCH